MERCQSLAQRAVKADREGNLAAASQLYLEAAQSLQVIPGGEQRYLSHITQYLNRHQEIQVELHRQNGHRPQEGEPANAEAHCIVDPSKLCVMEGMGLSTAACREGLLRFDNDLERATDWVFNNPGWHPSPQSPEHSHVPSNSSSRPSPSPAPSQPLQQRAQATQRTDQSPQNGADAGSDDLGAHVATVIPKSTPDDTSNTTNKAPIGKSNVLEMDQPVISELEHLRERLKRALVSESARCRCTLFSEAPGARCGKPAAINGETGEPEALCWSCKVIEVATGVDAAADDIDCSGNSDEDEYEDAFSGATQELPSQEPATRATSSASVKEEGMNNHQARRGFFGTIFGGLGANSNAASSTTNNEALKDEFDQLTRIKRQGGGLDEQQQVRRKELKKTLGLGKHNPGFRNKGAESPSKGSGDHQSSSAVGEAEGEKAEIVRLKQLLREALISAEMDCGDTRFNPDQDGLPCGRPCSIILDNDGTVRQTGVCWSCKRIEVRSGLILLVCVCLCLCARVYLLFRRQICSA